MSNIHHLRQVRRVPIAVPPDEPLPPRTSPERLAIACCTLGFGSGVLWTVLFLWLV